MVMFAGRTSVFSICRQPRKGPCQFLAVWPDARNRRFELRSVRFSVVEP
jgi:hypothetical protein